MRRHYGQPEAGYALLLIQGSESPVTDVSCPQEALWIYTAYVSSLQQIWQ